MKAIDIDETVLNSTDLLILNEINADPNFFCHNNINALSKKYYVSNATITRACKKFGFENLKSAQLKVNERISFTLNAYKHDDSGTTDAVLNNVKASVLYMVNETFNSSDKKVIENIGSTLINSDSIIIYGLENQKHSSESFVTKLQSINMNAFHVTNSYAFIEKAIYATKNSVIIIVLRQKPWEEIYNIIKWCIKQHVSLVLITPNVDKCRYELKIRDIKGTKIRFLESKHASDHESLKKGNIFTYSGDLVLYESIYQIMININPDLENRVNDVDSLYKKLVSEEE